MNERKVGPNDNNPPSPLDEIKARVAELVQAGKEWQDYGEIDSEEVSKELSAFLDQVQAEEKAVEKRRKDEKAPVLKLEKEIDGKYNPLKSSLSTVVGNLRPRLTAWMNKKEALRKAEISRQREEADRLRREAEKREAEAQKSIDADLAAQEAKRQADEAAEKARKLEAQKTQIRSDYGGRTRSLRTRPVLRIENIADIPETKLRELCSDPGVIEALEKVLRRDMDAARSIKGVKVEEIQEAA